MQDHEQGPHASRGHGLPGQEAADPQEGGERSRKDQSDRQGWAGQDARAKGADTAMDTDRQKRRRGGDKGETKAES